ncbi:MAG: NAD+ synthase [Endomicrobiales bacterium]|nr:NAD+ synthase [Endomicrobiales bacterium]
MKVAIAQINTTVGDISANLNLIVLMCQKAQKANADVVVFPELALCGYPPEDLLFKKSFIDDNLKALQTLKKKISKLKLRAIVGFVDQKGTKLFNAAALISKGQISAIYHKQLLPNYGVFDENRYFQSGLKNHIFLISGIKCGISICEDIWYDNGPVKKLSLMGAKVIFTLNASPYHHGKISKRETLVSNQAKKNNVSIVYANAVGAQDELVFDGYSMAVNSSGKIIARGKCFEEDLIIFDLPQSKPTTALATKLPQIQEIYLALKLGVKDYVRKNGFGKVIIGLSGGIDSALVAVIAADALDKENVTAVFMPSCFSSKASLQDATMLAKNLGIKLLTIPIKEIFDIYIKMLAPIFKSTKTGIAEENLQARIRGNLLMAISNKFGHLVLTTGNKSEMSTGYATLYGDMAGGFAVIKDVPKMLVYELSNYRNRFDCVIPKRILTKAPTAELRANQKDSDSLPEYSILDKILELYIEKDAGFDNITKKGFDKATVKKVLSLVDKSEYKRRQAPPGIKITPKAFGRDRRMPITNKYIQ